jgi:hypothetical protein
MWKKVVGYIVLVILLIAVTGFAYLYFRKPDMAAASTIKVEASAARIARGKYIFAVAGCEGCHSDHDMNRYDGPVPDGRHGVGHIFPEPGMPGRVVVPNITPDQETGIGKWTDGEKIRAIREGISRDGRVLFPLMPYTNFRYMSDDDVQSLVAYLNTLPPVRNELPATKIDFPVSLFIKSAPRPVLEAVKTPDRSNKVLYGEYLVTLGSCETCHTPAQRGQTDSTKRFAGGRRFGKSPMLVVSANITPDRKSGIGDWSLERFQQRFYKHREHAGKVMVASDPEKFTVMPWENLSQLLPEDLEAIFIYLNSRPAIENKVDSHPVEPEGKT